MLTQSLDRVWPRGAERHTFRFVGAQPEAEAEVAVRGGLSRLRLRRHDQGMARIDGDHRRADAEPWHRRANQASQGDGVVIELLSQPDLSDSEIVGAASLRDDVVDDVGGLRGGMQHDSGRHTQTNLRTGARIPRRRNRTHL